VERRVARDAPQKIFSSCAITLTWPLPKLRDWQRLRVWEVRRCNSHLISAISVTSVEHRVLEWQHDGLKEQWVHLAIYTEVIESQTVTLGHAQAAGNNKVAEMARAMDSAG